MEITTTACNVFIKENSLVSTKIEEINLNKDELGELKISITISGFSRKSDYSKINLLFSDIIEFKFYYTHIYNFYNVENVKLLHIDDCIYLSFDPDISDDKKSDDDSDFILAKKLELFIK
ncbi:hypothetical protein SD427_14495 [Chryseobacterium sp. JJR-5R]|uniref:hypothetical protein n=1 Tax=Chryseobacterium sp. JJR-5R TaxID=3093923 RepID=UPI002A756ECB|nr:hypothetical protein [Chryseobacterium sp. JJR-5R]WPO81967.1 hypothetical protein SD427_14495 [Chryseobacterium sp. JJR-5R]